MSEESSTERNLSSSTVLPALGAGNPKRFPAARLFDAAINFLLGPVENFNDPVIGFVGHCFLRLGVPVEPSGLANQK